MQLHHVVKLILSAILFIISFVVSIRVNLFFDAFLKASVVLAASLAIMYGFSWWFKQLISMTEASSKQTGASKKDQLQQTTKSNDSKASSQAKEDTVKGDFIDLSTPDEEDFIPWSSNEFVSEGKQSNEQNEDDRDK